MKDFQPYLFKSFAKTTGLPVRLYQNGQRAYYYSSTHLLPDPVALQLDEILASPHRAGIIVTPLFQHYGYARLGHDKMVILGPTAVLKEDAPGLDSVTFLLGIPKSEASQYTRRLCCSPEVSAEHLAWMLAFFVTAVEGVAFGVEEVQIDTKIKPLAQDIAQTHSSESFEIYEDTGLAETVLTSFRMERLVDHYVKNGEVEQMAELFESMPSIKAGKMAKDTLRQSKNMLICAATSVSRSAIGGGLEPQSAFKLSDLYIQKSELLRDADSVNALAREMSLDFTNRVRALSYGCEQDSKLFADCARYIKQNLFSRILVKDMAKTLGMSSAYLSTRFRAATGKTLSRFILEKKIDESKQLLGYANKSITEIAMHLGFSSQSHFQNVFKKQEGMTPLEFRRNFRQQSGWKY